MRKIPHFDKIQYYDEKQAVKMSLGALIIMSINPILRGEGHICPPYHSDPILGRTT